MLRVLYIAVNYGTPAHARRYVECLRTSPQEARLVLVDNTERERRVPFEVARDLQNVVYYRPTPANLGYFGGARYGAAERMAQSFDAEWTVISNVDLIFDPAQLRSALERQACARAGVVAPAIVSRDSRENLNPYMESRPTRTRMRAYKGIFRSYMGFVAYSWLSRAVRRRAWFRHAPDERTEDRAIYAPHGSFMVISREFFRRGGNLEHPPFLFGEEITIAEQARALELPVVFCPSILVTHEQHASTSGLPSRRQHGLEAAAAAYVADAYFRR